MAEETATNGAERSTPPPESTPPVQELLRRIAETNDQDQQRALREQLNAEQQTGIEGVQKRAALLRQTIENTFTTEQQEEKDRILANLDAAHSETLSQMHTSGQVDWVDRYSQEYLPYDWSTSAKRRTAMGVMIGGAVIGVAATWKFLKRIFGAAKEKVVETAQKTGSGLMTAAKWSLVGLGIDHFFLGGRVRRTLMGLWEGQALADEAKEKVKDAAGKAKEAGEEVMGAARARAAAIAGPAGELREPAREAAEQELATERAVLQAKEYMARWERKGVLAEVGIAPDSRKNFERILAGLLLPNSGLERLQGQHLARIATEEDARKLWAEINPGRALSADQAKLILAMAKENVAEGEESVTDAIEKKSLLARAFGRVREAVREGNIASPDDLQGIAIAAVELSDKAMGEMAASGPYFRELGIEGDRAGKERSARLAAFCIQNRIAPLTSVIESTPVTSEHREPLIKLQAYLAASETRAFLQKFTHGLEEPWKELEQYLDGSLRTGDALQLYTYIQMAGGVSGEVPENMQEGAAGGMLLLQLKVIELLRQLNEERAIQLEAYVGSKALAAPAELHIPPEVAALFGQLLGVVGDEVANRAKDKARRGWYWALYGIPQIAGDHPIPAGLAVAYAVSRGRRWWLDRPLRRMRTGAGIGQMTDTEITRMWGITDTAQARQIADEFNRQRTWRKRLAPGVSGFNARSYYAKLGGVLIHDLTQLDIKDISTKLNVSEAAAKEIKAEVDAAAQVESAGVVGKVLGRRRRQRLRTLARVRAILLRERGANVGPIPAETDETLETDEEAEADERKKKPGEADEEEETEQDTESDEEAAAEEETEASPDARAGAAAGAVSPLDAALQAGLEKHLQHTRGEIARWETALQQTEQQIEKLKVQPGQAPTAEMAKLEQDIEAEVARITGLAPGGEATAEIARMRALQQRTRDARTQAETNIRGFESAQLTTAKQFIESQQAALAQIEQDVNAGRIDAAGARTRIAAIERQLAAHQASFDPQSFAYSGQEAASHMDGVRTLHEQVRGRLADIDAAVAAQARPARRPRTIGADSADLGDVTEVQQELKIDVRTGKTDTKIGGEPDVKTDVDVIGRH